MSESPIARARAAASQQAPEETPAAESAPKPNYYCLEARHAPELISNDRFFYYEHPTRKLRLPDGQVVDAPTENCPVCPVCIDPHTKQPGKQVAAAALELDENGEPQIPASLLVLAERL